MPQAYYKPADLDPPILNGRAMGFSPEEIAAALGVPLPLVIDRLAANPVGTPQPLPMVRTAPPPKAVVKTRGEQAVRDPRVVAWERARKGARATREATR